MFAAGTNQVGLLYPSIIISTYWSPMLFMVVDHGCQLQKSHVRGSVEKVVADASALM